MQYQLSRVIAGPFLHAFGRPRATGLENIPASGPALAVSRCDRTFDQPAATVSDHYGLVAGLVLPSGGQDEGGLVVA